MTQRKEDIQIRKLGDAIFYFITLDIQRCSDIAGVHFLYEARGMGEWGVSDIP